jgi:hypothetical protein
MAAANHPSEPGVTGFIGLTGAGLAGVGPARLRRARHHAADGANGADGVDRHGCSICLRQIGTPTDRLMRQRGAYLTTTPVFRNE